MLEHDRSSHGQGAVIAELVGRFDGPGRFLDIGAGNGFDHSNTWALLMHGWSGSMVEGSPRSFASLYDTTRDFVARGKLSLYNLMVRSDDDQGTVLVFNDTVDRNDGRGTLYPEWKQCMERIHLANGKTDPIYDLGYYVATVTGRDLFSAVGCDYDLISLDIEGGGTRLVLDMPDELLGRCRIVVLEKEDGSPHTAMVMSRMLAHGFVLHSDLSGDLIWAKP